jgi:hypothetical protein
MSTHADHTKTGTGANIIHDAPVVKKDIVHEHPEIVHKEHHIQPVIHEKERHIQPVHKTEITTEHPIIHKETIVAEPSSHQAAGAHVGIGQKIKGTMKEVQGAVTGNELKKQEGRDIKQGLTPSTTTHH